MPDYDPDTTYLFYTNYLFSVIADCNSNFYYTTEDNLNVYENDDANLNINFSGPAPQSITYNYLEVPLFTEVILGKNVSYLDNNTFSMCANMSNITIPSTVTSIGSNAFTGCSNLSNITIDSSVISTSISIASNAFDGISKNVTLNWGNNRYVAEYFYNNLTLNGYNVTYNPSYTPPSPTITVEATYTLTSSGTDPTSNGASASSTFAVGDTESTGNVVTASSTFTASASGINKDDAIKSLNKHVHDTFVSPTVSKFSSKYQNISHNLTFTHN